MTQLLCLIVSADADASADWRRGLEPWGFRPHGVPHVEAALGLLGQCRFDAVLLDGDVGRNAGPARRPGARRAPLDALPALRGRTASPILLVWSEAGDLRQIEALGRGAADTVVKPASARLVRAKLKRLVEISQDGGRREAGVDGARRDPVDGTVSAGEVAFGPLRLDAGRALATCAGRPLAFTAGEFALVAMLAARSGEVVTRETIVRMLDAEGSGPSAGRPARRDTHRSADMHVCRIRRKLEAVGARLEGLRLATVHGRGYALRREPMAMP